MLKQSLKIILLVLILEIFSLTLTPFTNAKADDLIIDYDGNVTLIITDNQVLASETAKETPPKPSSTSPTVVVAPKVVPIASPAENTTIKINPKTITDNKKLKITIETTNTPTSTTHAPVQVNTNTQSEKTVDNVILRGSDKQPVLNIKPNPAQKDEVTIQQKDVNASTNLPLQIDSKTHIVSVETQSSTQKVSVLPQEAVQGANNKINSTIPVTKSDIKLSSDVRGQAEYVINQERKGKLFGRFDITIPSQVKISAQTGKTTSVWQSPLGFFIGSLIK